MNVRFLKVAQLDLDNAVDFYNTERDGLGLEFLWELFAAIERIKQFPDAWQPFYKGTRRCRIKRFPYGVIYVHDGDLILIFSIAHLHRPPEFYLKSINEHRL
jgi:hypothetical protein